MSEAAPFEPLTVTELRKSLKEFVQSCAEFGKRYTIMRHGRADAVLLSKADLDSVLETLAILSDRALIEQIAQSQEDLGAERWRSASEVHAEIERELDEDNAA